MSDGATKLREILNQSNKRSAEERKTEQKVRKFLKEYGSIKYNREHWKNTPMYRDAWREGYAAGRADAIQTGKEMVYEVVRLHYEDQLDCTP